MTFFHCTLIRERLITPCLITVCLPFSLSFSMPFCFRYAMLRYAYVIISFISPDAALFPHFFFSSLSPFFAHFSRSFYAFRKRYALAFFAFRFESHAKSAFFALRRRLRYHALLRHYRRFLDSPFLSLLRRTRPPPRVRIAGTFTSCCWRQIIFAGPP